MSVVAGICVFGLLTFFKPFNLHSVSTPELLRLSVVYAMATILVTTLVVVIMPSLLPSLFDDRHWTVAHEILLYLFLLALVALANTIVNSIIYEDRFSIRNFSAMLLMVFGVGALPVCLGVLAKQRRLYKRFQAAATEAEALVPLTAEVDHKVQPTVIKLVGTNRNEALTLHPDELLLMTASDNYVEIHWMREGKRYKQLFRNSLKAMETAVSEHPQFYRCHKANLINLTKVVHISGNAQGLKLQIEGIATLVPVSRNLTTDIKQKLQLVASASDMR